MLIWQGMMKSARTAFTGTVQIDFCMYLKGRSVRPDILILNDSIGYSVYCE
jgi:hypothetical protein